MSQDTARNILPVEDGSGLHGEGGQPTGDPTPPMPSTPPVQTATFAGKGHFMRFSGSGKTAWAVDRSTTPLDTTAVVTYADGAPLSAGIAVAGTMKNGSTVPSVTGVGGRIPSSDKDFPHFKDGDTFLSVLSTTLGRAVYGYETKDGTGSYAGFVAGGTPSQNLPTSGGAGYRVAVVGKMVGTQTGEAKMSGTGYLFANFTPGGGQVWGFTDGVDNLIETSTAPGASRLKFDLGFQKTNIAGGRFDGAVKVLSETNPLGGGGGSPLDNAGTHAPVPGTVVSSSSYSGAFFGDPAIHPYPALGTAATFQLEASNVPVRAGGVESIQAVGVIVGENTLGQYYDGGNW